MLRQYKSPLISPEISGFSLFSELFEDTFSGVWWADPNGDPYGSETPSVDRPCCIANVYRIACEVIFIPPYSKDALTAKAVRAELRGVLPYFGPVCMAIHTGLK